jgi:hypothetical protein
VTAAAAAGFRPAGDRRGKPYVPAMAESNMAKSNAKLSILGIVAIVAPLFAILGAATWFVAHTLLSLAGPPMPPAGYVAMTLGIVFSLVVGCGLMALLFYSSRHGYDEPFRPDNDRD